MIDLESLTISTKKSICIMMSYHGCRCITLSGGPFIEMTFVSFVKVIHSDKELHIMLSIIFEAQTPLQIERF